MEIILFCFSWLKFVPTDPINNKSAFVRVMATGYWINQFRSDSRFAPSQRETALLCNDVFRWVGASLESVLQVTEIYDAKLRTKPQLMDNI